MVNLSSSATFNEKKAVVVSGGEVWYLEEGNGIPVLFLSGWGGSTEKYYSIQNKLASRGYRVFLPDLPGLPGKTSSKIIHLPEWSDWIEEFSRAAIREQFFLVSHSLSAQIALQYASKDDSRCLGVVLLGPWLVPSHRQQVFWRSVAHSVRFLCPIIYPDMKWVKDKKSWTNAIYLISETATIPKVPCLIIWGKRDPARILLTGWEKIHCMTKQFNWDHSPQIRATTELAHEIDEFINRTLHR
jgi:pimeloyl-ACP methyl ester carboxylesterase